MMKYLSVVYVVAVVVGLSGLAHAMTTDEVSNIGYVAPKKIVFRALDRGLVSSTHSSVPATGVILSGDKTESARKLSVVVDVRQGLDDQGFDEQVGDNSADETNPTQPDQQTGVTQTGLQSDMIYLNDWQYVDVDQVRDTWLQWTNYLRTEQLGGREAYVADRRLNATATARSQYAASIGSISHKRKSSDGYYNYNGLVQWFKWKGEELTGSPIVFRNVSRATFSESIGRGMYGCGEADCTDEVIEATRSTWNFFYRERAANGVHYRALTHKNFGIQGLGIAFSGKKYFLTIHYGTSIME